MPLTRSSIRSIILVCISVTMFVACAGKTGSQHPVASDVANTLKSLPLPAPQKEIGRPLMQVLAERRTTRDLRPDPLSKQTLSNLLWAAFGINRPDSGKRTAPSALNWQEISIYVALQNGLYVYEPIQHQLIPVVAKDLRADTTRMLQPARRSIENAPLSLIYVADFSKANPYGVPQSAAQKTLWAHADTGFIAQNVYLFCASADLGTVVRGMVDKPALKEKMQLRKEQHIILCQTVGYPAARPLPKAAFDLQAIPDGTYTGEAFLESTEARVQVRVRGHRITEITPLGVKEDAYAQEALNVVGQVLKTQSTDVDAVSGATVSSRAMLKAVENALSGARP